MTSRFAHRQQAGKLLATKLTAYADRPQVLVLALPRFGIPVAMVQGLAACYALCWMPLAIVCLQTPLGLMLPVPFGYPVIAILILLIAGTTAVFCLLGAVASFKVSRLTKRCTI